MAGQKRRVGEKGGGLPCREPCRNLDRRGWGGRKAADFTDTADCLGQDDRICRVGENYGLRGLLPLQHSEAGRSVIAADFTLDDSCPQPSLHA